MPNTNQANYFKKILTNTTSSVLIDQVNLIWNKNPKVFIETKFNNEEEVVEIINLRLEISLAKTFTRQIIKFIQNQEQSCDIPTNFQKFLLNLFKNLYVETNETNSIIIEEIETQLLLIQKNIFDIESKLEKCKTDLINLLQKDHKKDHKKINTAISLLEKLQNLTFALKNNLQNRN